MNRAAHLFNFIKNFFRVKIARRNQYYDTKLVLEEWHKPSKPLTCPTEPLITWVGQATFLIQIDGLNIVTDPIFFDLSVFFPRIVPVGIEAKELPPIDVVLISHDHRDHMEKRSMKALAEHDPIVLAPHGVGKRLSRWGVKRVREHRWGDKHVITTPSEKKLTFTFLPSAHWAGSNLFNMNKSGYGSWMVEHEDHTTYFAGDSSYNKHYVEIGQEFSKIETALLPIGPIEPRELVEHAHLDGKQALQAFIDMNARQFIPMHWGTFQFGIEHFDEPVKRLRTWWDNRQAELEEKRLSIIKFGQAHKLSL